MKFFKLDPNTCKLVFLGSVGHRPMWVESSHPVRMVVTDLGLFFLSNDLQAMPPEGCDADQGISQPELCIGNGGKLCLIGHFHKAELQGAMIPVERLFLDEEVYYEAKDLLSQMAMTELNSLILRSLSVKAA